MELEERKKKSRFDTSRGCAGKTLPPNFHTPLPNGNTPPPHPSVKPKCQIPGGRASPEGVRRGVPARLQEVKRERKRPSSEEEGDEGMD